MQINLISNDNGVGLSRDIELLESLFRELGHRVNRVHWEAVESPTADVNFHIELIGPQHFATADKHVGIFNLEWFPHEWAQYLGRYTQLWAKSCEAFEFFMEMGLDTGTHTGFLSRDLYDQSILKQPRVLHLKGRSQYKNTDAVIEAYRKHGAQLPPLTVISQVPLEVLPGVDQWIGTIEDHKLLELMNSHAWHLCPSECEGWGHSIVEALSCKAIVIATDASPMNEHVLPGHGLLIEPKSSVRSINAWRHDIDPDAIAAALMTVAVLDDDTILSMRAKARVWFNARQASFVDKAKILLSKLA